jgi:hypothetical protein
MIGEDLVNQSLAEVTSLLDQPVRALLRTETEKTKRRKNYKTEIFLK